MAIKKQITADNGIATEYHRIAMVKIDTNQLNTFLFIPIYLKLVDRSKKIMHLDYIKMLKPE